MANNAPKANSYIDCSLLAERMFDQKRAKEFENKAIDLFKTEHKDNADLKSFYISNYYHRKGYIEGSINTLSYKMKITKGAAAMIINDEGYCDHYKW